jgi:hypothetical protein
MGKKKPAAKSRQQKTLPTERSVAEFVAALPDATQRADCAQVIALMQGATKAEPKLWGSSIIGFGQYHYRYDSGCEGDSCLVGFAPRKGQLVLYLLGAIAADETGLLEKLGPHKAGKGCLYIKRLADIHVPTLKKLIAAAVKHARQQDRAT